MNPDDNKPANISVNPTAPVEPVTPGNEPVATDTPTAKCAKCSGDSENGNCKTCAMSEGECSCPPAAPEPTETPA